MRRPLLTHDDVHRIRTGGLTDSHWEKALGVSRAAVQKARSGTTWPTHPTPPDTAMRTTSEYRGGGRPQTRRLPQMSEIDERISRALAKWARVEISGSID